MGNKQDPRNIIITLKELAGGNVEIVVEDSGTGIKNIDEAFTLGCQASGESPLNEHGFGLKHALASANPQNDTWEICTRNIEDFNSGMYKKISAPYKIRDFHGEVKDEDGQDITMVQGH